MSSTPSRSCSGVAAPADSACSSASRTGRSSEAKRSIAYLCARATSDCPILRTFSLGLGAEPGVLQVGDSALGLPQDLGQVRSGSAGGVGDPVDTGLIAAGVRGIVRVHSHVGSGVGKTTRESWGRFHRVQPPRGHRSRAKRDAGPGPDPARPRPRQFGARPAPGASAAASTRIAWTAVRGAPSARVPSAIWWRLLVPPATTSVPGSDRRTAGRSASSAIRIEIGWCSAS